MKPPAEPIVKEKSSKKGVKRDTATENSESESEKLNNCQAKKSKSSLSASKAEIIAYKATIEEQNRIIRSLQENIAAITDRLEKLETNIAKTV